eukprot:TRINITY_DN12614_c0_g1_i3.p4 TRINITY_DN12614_c0_g1~~TRINITY_DN12614_c0_g1_i3.p4  ORF type:complete len:106 (+),score=11.93 TRINITY_DN12614_c0_g1_i3:616-933(+)
MWCMFQGKFQLNFCVSEKKKKKKKKKKKNNIFEFRKLVERKYIYLMSAVLDFALIFLYGLFRGSQQKFIIVVGLNILQFAFLLNFLRKWIQARNKKNKYFKNVQL